MGNLDATTREGHGDVRLGEKCTIHRLALLLDVFGELIDSNRHRPLRYRLNKAVSTMVLSSEGVGLRAVIASSLFAAVYAFQARPTFNRVGSSALKMVAVDPSTVTNKEYEDICGVSFDEGSLEQRLRSTKFLYPKHVEVIEEIGPIAGDMVDKIVSLASC